MKKKTRELLHKAEEAYDRGDLAEMESTLDQALKMEPENPEVLNNLGVLRYQQGRLSDAEHALEKALRESGAGLDVVQNAALVFTEAGRSADAFALLLGSEPENLEAETLHDSLHSLAIELLSEFSCRAFDSGWTAATALRQEYAQRARSALRHFEQRFAEFPLGRQLELLSTVWLLLGEEEKAAVGLQQLVLHQSEERAHYLALARCYLDAFRVYDARFVLELLQDRLGPDPSSDSLFSRLHELNGDPRVRRRYESILIATDTVPDSLRKLGQAVEAIKAALRGTEVTVLTTPESSEAHRSIVGVDRILTEPDDRQYDIGFECVGWEELRQRFGDYGHRLCRTFYTIHSGIDEDLSANPYWPVVRFFDGAPESSAAEPPEIRAGDSGLQLVTKKTEELNLVKEENRLYVEKDGQREPFTVHLVGARWSNFPWGMENELFRALEVAGARLIDTDFRRDFDALPGLLKKPAHLLWVVKGNGIPPELIQAFPGKSILWYQDDIFATDHAPRHIEHNARAFDTVYSFDACALDEYRKYGVDDVRWLPLAMSPAVHRKLFLPKDHDVVFVGRVYPQRAELLGRLQQSCGLLVTEAYADDMVRLFNQARIVLNIGVGRTGIQARVFEALGCGSFLLTNEIPEETRLFEDRKHLAYFNEGNVEDLIQYFLAHPEEREEIALQGYLEANARHTFEHRVQQVLGDHFGVRSNGERIRVRTTGADRSAAREPKGPRILVVGFDGMEANILLDHLDEFPTFKELMAESSWGVLEVTPCPGTLEGWASIYTGCTPPKHGMDEVAWKAAGGRIEDFPKFADLRVPTVWEMFDQSGRSTGCFNIPFVHYMPQRPDNRLRYMVPGYFVPPHIRPYPRQIWPMLEGYPSEQGSIISHKPHVPPEEWSNATGEHQRRLKKQYVHEAMGRDLQRLETCLKLVRAFQPDFSFNVFHETDRIGHFVLDHPDLMVQGYKIADQILARMMELDYDYLVVISDHGIWHQDSELCERTVKITGRSEFASGGYRLANSTHSAHAVFLVYGDGIAAGRQIQASLYDVTPTLCRLAGVPVPEHVDGRVLEEIFAGQVLDDEEQERLQEQLAGLGYI